MLLSSYAKDTYFAPHMSKFTSAAIPDMSEFEGESATWLWTFGTLTMLGLNLPLETQQAMFNFLRRAEAMYRAYEAARVESIKFISASGEPLITYARAVSYWETFLSQAWQGYALVRLVFSPAVNKVFEPGDGSVEERLYELYNATKHTESRIADGRMPDGTMPVWLTNTGLQGHQAALSYEEAAAELQNLVQWARRFRDPAAMVRAIRNGENMP